MNGPADDVSLITDLAGKFSKTGSRGPSSVFRLDYLSCLLTISSTILVGRKQWTGFVVAGVNSVIICAIGLRTSQLGLIPANVFCLIVYVFSIRSWIREQA